jgi:hypothetical protein
MLTALGLANGVTTALLAGRKGYNSVLWFFAAGVIGLVILAFLPFVNEKSNLPEMERSSMKKTGDTIAGVIAAVAVGLLLAKVIGGALGTAAY